ncbi:hypothetical protein EMIT0P201_60236 [Pseudomonas chlororaphis]
MMATLQLPQRTNSLMLETPQIVVHSALRQADRTTMSGSWLPQPQLTVQATELTAARDLCPQVKRALELQERQQGVTSPVPMHSPVPQASQYGRSFLMSMLGNVPENIAPGAITLHSCKSSDCLECVSERSFQ